jgi:hypothetical protein
MNSRTLSIIDNYTSQIKSLTASQKVDKGNDIFKSTVRDLDGCIGVVKLEISVDKGAAVVSKITGDTITVLGCVKSELKGENLFKFFNIDPNISTKAWQDLNNNNFAFKRHTIVGKDGFTRELEGWLFWREVGKSMVEFIRLV